MMSLTFGLFTQVSGSGPLGPLVFNETDQIIYFQELADLRKADMRSFRNISVDESNILMWQGLIVPVSIAVSVREAKMRKNWITVICRYLKV